ncbi:MAG: hypothetical protein HN909_04380 [Phycisphaerales bacterium]|nr:hypothetical protein [Phycisphaerales bacterium]
MNLLPEWYVRERMRNRADMFCVVLFGIVMAGLMVDEYIGRSKLRKSREKYDVAMAKFDRSDKEAIDFSLAQTERTQVLKEVLQEATGQQYFTPLMLSEVLENCAKQGEGIVFESMDMRTAWKLPEAEKKKPVHRGPKQTTSAKPPLQKREVTIILKGTATSNKEEARLVNRLDDTEFFSSVSLERTVMRKSSSGDSAPPRRAFTIMLMVKSDEELIATLLDRPRHGVLIPDSDLDEKDKGQSSKLGETTTRDGELETGGPS